MSEAINLEILEWKPPKWEYQMLTFPAIRYVSDIGDDLTEAGKEGWELVCVVEAHDITGWSTFIMKRMITDETETD